MALQKALPPRRDQARKKLSAEAYFLVRLTDEVATQRNRRAFHEVIKFPCHLIENSFESQ